MAEKSVRAVWILLLLLCLVLVGCDNQAPKAQSATDASGVTFSRLTESEIDQLPAINKLPKGTCVTNNLGAVCAISPDQLLKWGWGFCENDKAALATSASATKVELLVNSVRIADDVIYERDESYDRKQNPYCHTWLIKLSKWQSGKSIQLESNVVVSTANIHYNAYHNVYVMNVR